MTTRPMGLRERKKKETRQQISNIATRMFIERGFDEVTIAEIAQAAEVAKMTVTNYFPRKEDLVLDLHDEIVAHPARTVAERASGESALAALRRDYFAALERRDALLGFSGRPFARTVTGSPALLARLRELHEQRETALAAVLAGEPGTDGADGTTGDVIARMVAGQLVSALRVLFGEAIRRTLDGEDEDTVAAALHTSATQVFDLLEPSLGAYAVR
ncbi:TetR family transcriptional regulator [Streptosporangium sp. NPDC048047]|uniref:TetR/AcrR family transcriptional regulator n=1 Tax=Streptosporangium sp. NPDC048047 TaxID=3155748 RepID=UPI003449E959